MATAHLFVAVDGHDRRVELTFDRLVDAEHVAIAAIEANEIRRVLVTTDGPAGSFPVATLEGRKRGANSN